MPIKKTSKGWYWGSKGPFKSKKKARQVEKAAYASGYKKKKKKKRRKKMEQLVPYIVVIGLVWFYFRFIGYRRSSKRSGSEVGPGSGNEVGPQGPQGPQEGD